MLEQQLKIKPPAPTKTPVKPGKPSPPDSAASDAPWVVQTGSDYSWADGSFTLDSKGASTALGCSQNKFCWGILGIKGTLSPRRFVDKCCTTPEHGGPDSEVHKRTLEAREDVATKAIVNKHITVQSGNSVASGSAPTKRQLTPTEDGRGKKHKANTDGDGPTGSFSLVELFAGLCSFALAARLGSLPMQLSTFYEISSPAVAYSEHFFSVCNSGDVRQVSDGHHDVVSVTMDCSPYSRAGLQRFRKDPKHVQAFWAAEAVRAIAPLVGVLEQVPDFYLKDDEHGIFTEMCTMMADTVVALPTVFVFDTHLGGWIHRERGITFFEAPAVRDVMPAWIVSAPTLDMPTSRELSWLDPVQQVSHTVRHGTFRACSGRDSQDDSLQSQVPVIIGWLQWGGPSTALQSGILISIQGEQWKVQDVSRHDPSKLRLIKEVGRFATRKHTECFIKAAQITPRMHEAKWYPVFSASSPQRSPRRFFQHPDGCMNLFLDPRFSEPVVRFHTDNEVWSLIHFGVPEHVQDMQRVSQRQAQLTGKEVQECAAGAVTYCTTRWIMQQLALRVQAYAHFVQSQWPPPLSTKHMEAAGMVADTKRVVMLLCTLHPAPALLLPGDHAVLCTDIIDASRAHKSALEVCSAWAASLGVQVEPVLVGPITLSTLAAAVLVFAVPISSSEDPLPELLTPAIAQWTLSDQLTGLLRIVSDVAFAKLSSFMGPCSSMSTLFSEEAMVGAASGASVAVSASAPNNELIPYEYAVQRAARSTRHLRAAMLSSEAAASIQRQVDGMKALCPATVDVKAIMSSFADRIMDPVLQEVPPNVQETGCQSFADQYYATLQFDESCLHPVTSWYPLLPEQRLPHGFNPEFQDDLYHHLPSVKLQDDAWFASELANIDNMAAYPDALRRLHSDRRVIPESLRVPNARGYIFDVNADKRVTLTQFHAPIQTQFNRTFIASVTGITALPENPGASLPVQTPKFHDLELLSDVILGCRLKAPVHTHSVYQRNMLSLAKNITGIEKQAVQKQERGIAEVHQHTTYCPSRYVSCGSVERKENPGNPRNTDNHSDPLEAFQDADGVSVESLNGANHRVSKQQEQAIPAGSLAPERHQQHPFAVDPDEQKCTIPQIVSDAMVLKHVADQSGEEVFIAKFDMAFFFDQFVLAIQERWKNFRFLRVVPELVQISKLPKDGWKGMHQAHQRLGFGGRRNSKIAQRFAHLFVWVVNIYMEHLEQPCIEAATGYQKQWIQLRRCMNKECKTNQARRHALHMYTDDLISLSLTGEASRNLVVAVYLAALNMGVVLADVYKLEMGVAVKALGIYVFVAFAIVVIPTDKRLDGAQRLVMVAQGCSTYEGYERLLGLLVHCLMMVYMDDTLLENMWKPLAFMRHRHQGKQEMLDPKFHKRLHSVWEQWRQALLTRPAARFTAALGDERHAVRNVPTVHMYGDVFRSS